MIMITIKKEEKAIAILSDGVTYKPHPYLHGKNRRPFETGVGPPPVEGVVEHSRRRRHEVKAHDGSCWPHPDCRHCLEAARMLIRIR